jgi:hypothetical protein
VEIKESAIQSPNVAGSSADWQQISSEFAGDLLNEVRADAGHDVPGL